MLLFAMAPVVLVANLVNGTLVAAVFIEKRPLLVALWWSLLCIMVAVRGMVLIRCREGRPLRQRWAAVMVVGSGASGVLWGAAGFLLFSAAGETHRLVLGFVLGGMGAGALTALTPYLPAYYAYLFPSTLPFVIRLTQEGDAEHLTMALACAMYVASLAVLGRKANAWLRDSVARRYENDELVRSLERRVEERTRELQSVNQRLQRDIAERERAEAALANYGDRQAKIAEFGKLALSGTDLDRLFAKAMVLVRDGLEVSGAALIADDEDGRDASVRVAVGLEDAMFFDRPGAADRPLHLLDGTSAVQFSDRLAADLRQLRDPKTSTEVVVYRRDLPSEMLVAFNAAPRTYSAHDVNFLRSIANMLAAAIERKRVEEDVERMALRDSLTGLPNRALFRNQLHQEVTRAARSRHMVGVLLLDLDHFKDVNDALGHPTGDRLLVAVGKRLAACLREADLPARLGGDEFAVILPELEIPEDAAVVAAKVVACLAEPFWVDARELHIGASVGITISPADGINVDALLCNADLALYRAKAEGRNTYRFYTAHMAVQVEARKSLEQDFRRALDRSELLLEFQPQYDLATSRLAGAEALVRWRHPTRGLLRPDEFIPLAEAIGLITRLGRWVLEQVARRLAEWQDRGVRRIFMAANVSLSQCQRGDLVATIEDIAERTGCDLRWLELEVTENLFLPSEDGEIFATLRRLRELGVSIAIDDFGTGYSSLGRLKSVPVDKVKIDKTFIAGLGSSRDAEMIVRAIIALARSLGMKVTAEGVESADQLDFLIAEGCHTAQGYHLSLPLPHHEFAQIVYSDMALFP